MTHICVGKLTIIGSDNGLSPGQRQAITRTSARVLLIWPLGTNFSEILTGIQTFSFKKMHLEMSWGKWRPFCLGLSVLKVHSGTTRNGNFWIYLLYIRHLVSVYILLGTTHGPSLFLASTAEAIYQDFIMEAKTYESTRGYISCRLWGLLYPERMNISVEVIDKSIKLYKFAVCLNNHTTERVCIPILLYSLMHLSLCNAYEHRASVEEIYMCPIFTWVAETWLYDKVARQ